jgi:RNA polymerase sigma-70 factor, ECF subfamily
MITAELTLNKATYFDSWFAAFIQNHSANHYVVDNSLAQADTNDITAILNGNGDAFTALIKRYQNQIAAKMWRFTRDKQQVEELVQDVFIEVYRSLRGFKPSSPFLPWLMKIAVRVGYRYWNNVARNSKEIPLDEFDESIMTNRQIKPDRAGEILHDLLAKLSSKDRLVLTLSYFEDCSVAEVAELTGWSQIMVKVRAHRARGKLKRLIEQSMAIK